MTTNLIIHNVDDNIALGLNAGPMPMAAAPKPNTAKS